MTKRVVAGVLWAYLALYAWIFYAGMAGWNPLWGPVVVLAFVALVAARRVHARVAAASRTAPVNSAPAAHAEPI
jgi:hypothetical protein